MLPRLGSAEKLLNLTTIRQTCDPNLTRGPLVDSVQNSASSTSLMHRLDFNVVLRKLIPKLQAFSKRIQEASMVRFYSSIHADDKMLIRQMSRDSAFHGIPHPSRCRTSNKDRMPRQRSRSEQHSLISCQKLVFLTRRCDIWVGFLKCHGTGAPFFRSSRQSLALFRSSFCLAELEGDVMGP